MNPSPVVTHLPPDPTGKQFALTVGGQSKTYTNNKEGKRQAILDGLSAIETVAIGQDVYLPSNESLQVVAAVLYPDGIQTESAYQTVCDVTEKACAHLGYGSEVELGPPAVPFSRRGSFRKKHPPVAEQMVLDELDLGGTSSTHPRQEVACTIVWNKVGLEVYGRHWSQLTPAEQSLIQAQVAAEFGQTKQPSHLLAAAAGLEIAVHLLADAHARHDALDQRRERLLLRADGDEER